MHNKRKTVLVLGGKGFIGSSVVRALRKKNLTVLIGSRTPDTQTERKVKLHQMTNASDWQALAREADVVINTVGILRQRFREKYEQVHHYAVSALSQACAEHGTRLIHVSALGLENKVQSRFLSSKRRGEQALMASNCDWAIVRPSLVDGAGGYGAKWLRRTACWPVHLAPANANGLITPLDADDLGIAIANIAACKKDKNDVHDRIFELGGEQTMNLFQYQALLNGQPSQQRKFAIPAWIARSAAHLCDVLHLTPFSFGHYELLKFDNCPEHNRLRETLGRAPRKIKPYRAALNLQIC